LVIQQQPTTKAPTMKQNKIDWILDNLTNGNLTDAKRAARFITWERIYKHAREMMDEPRARVTADYLKGQIAFDRYCNATA
jgi:hypothetical protein